MPRSKSPTNKKKSKGSKSPVKRSKSCETNKKNKKTVLIGGSSSNTSLESLEQTGGSLSKILINILLLLLIVLALYCVYALIFNKHNDYTQITNNSNKSNTSDNYNDNNLNMLSNNNNDNNLLNRFGTNLNNILNTNDNEDIKIKNLNININNDGNIGIPSTKRYLVDKAHERIVNPLLPPERSYENTYGVPINIPSRGYAGGYQQIGYLYKDEISDSTKQIGNNSESVIIPMYGAPTYNGSNRWNYYISSDKFHSVKIPFLLNGRSSDDEHGIPEIYDGEKIQLPPYNGDFKVKIYKYDKPRYIPYVW
jgi:hypothetical protein